AVRFSVVSAFGGMRPAPGALARSRPWAPAQAGAVRTDEIDAALDARSHLGRTESLRPARSATSSLPAVGFRPCRGFARLDPTGSITRTQPRGASTPVAVARAWAPPGHGSWTNAWHPAS